MPKVSVIVPIYNVGKYIKRCLYSLFKQTLDDIEYIFVNDCTTDESMIVLESVLNQFPHRRSQVKIINHSQNLGLSSARRTGLKAVTGDYVIHCDADDWVDLEMYEKMYVATIENSADMVCCDIQIEFKDYHKVLKYNNKYHDRQLMRDCIAPISVEYCSLCNKLVSRQIYDQYSLEPFPRINMWEDVGLSTRIRYYAVNPLVINIPFYHYNKLNENATTRRSILDRVEEQIECAVQLEKFFIKESALKEYATFISFIKLVAKYDLIDYDVNKWKHTFPETRRNICLLKHQMCPQACILKMYIISYGGIFGKIFLKVYRATRALSLKS